MFCAIIFLSALTVADPVSAAPQGSSTNPLRHSDWQVEDGPVELGPAADALSYTIPASLEEFEQFAIERNPAITAAAAALRAAQCDTLQAGLYPNPSIGYLGTEIGNDGRAGQQGMLLKQTWVRGGKLALNRAVANRQAAILGIQYDRQYLRVITEVRVAFYRLLIAQRRREVAQQLSATSSQAAETADRLLQAQEGKRSDVLQAKIEYERSQVDVRRAEAIQMAAWRELLSVIGAAPVELGTVDGDIDIPADVEWNAALQRLLAESPEIIAAELGIERAELVLRHQCAKQVPDLDALVAVQYDNSTRDTYASFEFSVPLQIHNRNQGNIGAARARISEAHANVDRVALDFQRRLADEFQRYQAAQYEVQRYQAEIIPRARETLQLVDQGYQGGETTFLELLTAQRTFFQVNLANLDALQQLWSSYLRIDGLLVLGGQE